jgi:hypothetical protein
MSELYQFSLAENMSHNNGEVFGYFAIQSRHTGISGQIEECLAGIDDLEEQAAYIPIVTDEFGLGESLNNYLSNHTELAGFLTFGTDEEGKLPSKLRYSHTKTLLHVVGRVRPDFIGARLALPDGLRSVHEWHAKEALLGLHLRYGSVAVQNDVCTIQVIPDIEPLTPLW